MASLLGILCIRLRPKMLLQQYIFLRRFLSGGLLDKTPLLCAQSFLKPRKLTTAAILVCLSNRCITRLLNSPFRIELAQQRPEGVGLVACEAKACSRGRRIRGGQFAVFRTRLRGQTPLSTLKYRRIRRLG